MLTVVILIQMLILVQMANLYTKVEELRKDRKEHDEDIESEYRRGQEWACTEFYGSGCTLEELRERLVEPTGSYIPTDFEAGALQTLQELKKRRRKGSRGPETKFDKQR